MYCSFFGRHLHVLTFSCSSELSSYSPEVERLTVYAKSFILPHNVETLAMTSTKYGISAKDLIGESLPGAVCEIGLVTNLLHVVSTTEGQIQSFPRRLLDPRRHKEKPSAADAEEQLIPYEPLVGDDHRRVLSHDSEVRTLSRLLLAYRLIDALLFHPGRWRQAHTHITGTSGVDLAHFRIRPRPLLHAHCAVWHL